MAGDLVRSFYCKDRLRYSRERTVQSLAVPTVKSRICWSPYLALPSSHRRLELGASCWLRYRLISTWTSELERVLRRGSCIEESKLEMWACFVWSSWGVVRAPHLGQDRQTFFEDMPGPAHDTGDQRAPQRADETGK